MDENKETLRAQAQQLFRRGLLLYKENPQTEVLRAVAELWQEAKELYRRAGDRAKQDEIDACFGKIESKFLNFPSRVAAIVSSGHGAIPEEDGRASLWIRARGKEIFKDWHVFLKIGCFGFGGPMAVWGLLQEELVRRRKILSNMDFLEAAVLGDILPGPVTMDIVTYTGYKLRRWWGSALATLLFVLPSFMLMLVVASYYDRFITIPVVKSVFRCLGATVTAILISVGLNLSREQLKDYSEVGIFLWAFVSSLVFKLDMFLVVILAGLAGLLLELVRPSALTRSGRP